MGENQTLQFRQQDDLAPFPEAALGAAFVLVPLLLIDMTNLANQGKPVGGLLASSLALILALATFRLSAPLMLLLACVGSGIHWYYIDQATFTLIAWPWMGYITSRWQPPPMRVGLLVTDGIVACIGGFRWAAWLSEAYGFGIPAAVVLATVMNFGITLFAFLIGLHVSANAKINAEFLWGLWDAQQAFDTQLREERVLASAATRLDISRELHDVLGHSLAVIVRQADGGAALGEKDPAAAIEALQTISTVSREVLQEIRTVIGQLRVPATPEAVELVPQPGLEQIQTLVERAGDRVQLRTIGQPYPVSPIVGVTAYRIAQEAITNFFKHAGPEGRATVELAYRTGLVEVDVANTGALVSGLNLDSGNGIRGMSERVSALHGELVYGSQPGGGFVVHARLPVSSAS